MSVNRAVVSQILPAVSASAPSFVCHRYWHERYGISLVTPSVHSHLIAFAAMSVQSVISLAIGRRLRRSWRQISTNAKRWLMRICCKWHAIKYFVVYVATWVTAASAAATLNQMSSAVGETEARRPILRYCHSECSHNSARFSARNAPNWFEFNQKFPTFKFLAAAKQFMFTTYGTRQFLLFQKLFLKLMFRSSKRAPQHFNYHWRQVWRCLPLKNRCNT